MDIEIFVLWTVFQSSPHHWSLVTCPSWQIETRCGLSWKPSHHRNPRHYEMIGWARTGNGSHNKLVSTYEEIECQNHSSHENYKGKITENELFLVKRLLLVQIHVKQARKVGFGQDILYQDTKSHSSETYSATCSSRYRIGIPNPISTENGWSTVWTPGLSCRTAMFAFLTPLGA